MHFTATPILCIIDEQMIERRKVGRKEGILSNVQAYKLYVIFIIFIIFLITVMKNILITKTLI